jgi:hypothetical protein
MKGLRFYDSDEGQGINEQGKIHEHSAKILFQGYLSLIHTYKEISELFLKGEVKSEGDLLGMAYSMFSKTFASRTSSEISAVLP